MSYYRESQARIDEAEAALREGDDDRARALYREAARLQRAFIDSVPPERVRTRSVYGLSVATLLHRAGDLNDAERLAHLLLVEPWIEAYSAGQLRLLLDRIWSDRRASSPSVVAEASEASPKRRLSPAPPRSQRRARNLPAMSKGRRLTASIRRHV